MSTADLGETTVGRSPEGLGWSAMIKDMLAFMVARRTDPSPEVTGGTDPSSPDEEDRAEREVFEISHPMYAVHFASPQF